MNLETTSETTSAITTTNANIYTDKRNRKHTAQQLPHGITQGMMRKYVVYYREYTNVFHTHTREFFKVEKHPKLNGRTWISRKSGKIALEEKLADANKVVDDLEKNIFPYATPTSIDAVSSIDADSSIDTVTETKPTKPKLPKYIRLDATHKHMIYDKKDTENEFRWTFRLSLHPDLKIEEHIPILYEKLNEKYGIDFTSCL
jgi:hypothetical protein